MRFFSLLISLCLLIGLSACGSEEEITPPEFSNILVNGLPVSSTFSDLIVTITGNVDDFAATVVANSTATGEVSLPVDSSNGSWSFVAGPLLVGSNIISFTASDPSGNINQLILTVLYAPLPE